MGRDSGNGWGEYHRPKIVGLGESSAHWFLAGLACETGISPRELMLLDDRMLWTMNRWLIAKATSR